MIVCAEIGLQHCGCLGTAFAFVDAIADAGADIFKAQCHEGDPCVKYRPGMGNYFHESRQDYWKRTAFTRDQWAKLAEHVRNRYLQFSCSVFSLQGVELMTPLVDQFKVPSSKTNDLELIKAVIATGMPVVLSTGMSTSGEVRRATDLFDDAGLVPTVLECASEYPTPAEHILLQSPRPWPLSLYPWGLSDHSGALWPGIVAAWEGASMLEVHVTWHRSAFGPDVSSSLTIEELGQLVRGVSFIEEMRASTITKDELARELEPVRRVFRGV